MDYSFPSPSLAAAQNQKSTADACDGGPEKGTMSAVKLSTDAQSVAARERRHRISERFKILQSLVPGGTKMDTVTMLEEAIHYVKFLKAQIWLHQTMILTASDCLDAGAYAYDGPHCSMPFDPQKLEVRDYGNGDGVRGNADPALLEPGFADVGFEYDENMVYFS